MSLKIVAAPENDPITLAQAKAHLRVDHSDDDTLIEALIAAATQYCDGPHGFLGRALIQQTWDLYLDEFPSWRGSGFYRNRRYGHAIEIPLPPLISVAGVFYLDTAGDEHEIDAASYVVDPISEPGRVVPARGACWPTVCDTNAVRVRFTAGYVDATNSPATDNVPKPIYAGMLLYIGDLYANRETMLTGQRAAAVTLPWAAEQLLRPYRFTLSLA
jgi:uncharacterized phiE125 gp8 family phage protein